MRVLFQPVRGRVDLQRILREDGWTLEGGGGDSFLARNPGVPDEAAARSRLHRLGLLTSPRLRIVFLPATLS